MRSLLSAPSRHQSLRSGERRAGLIDRVVVDLPILSESLVRRWRLPAIDRSVPPTRLGRLDQLGAEIAGIAAKERDPRTRWAVGGLEVALTMRSRPEFPDNLVHYCWIRRMRIRAPTSQFVPSRYSDIATTRVPSDRGGTVNTPRAPLATCPKCRRVTLVSVAV